MWIQWPFLINIFKNTLHKRSLTPRWPSTPSLLRSHVWRYPRIMCPLSKSHENTSKYVDTVTLFSKTWTKGHWPLDDLWPHVCWGHICDSAQGSLCPSPMKIHQCMWIQWSELSSGETKKRQKKHTFCVFLKYGDFWSKFSITNVFLVKFPFYKCILLCTLMNLFKGCVQYKIRQK